jgi:hypothetical protein
MSRRVEVGIENSLTASQSIPQDASVVELLARHVSRNTLVDHFHCARRLGRLSVERRLEGDHVIPRVLGWRRALSLTSCAGYGSSACIENMRYDYGQHCKSATNERGHNGRVAP